MNKNKKIGDKMIYFDSAATTKPLKEVVETYNKMNDEYWFNPSSMYKDAVFVKTLIDRASKSILKILNLNVRRYYIWV